MQRLGVSRLVSEALSNKSYSWRSWLARQTAIQRQGYRRLNAFHFAPAISQLVPDRIDARSVQHFVVVLVANGIF